MSPQICNPLASPHVSLTTAYQHTFMGASNSRRIGCEMKISRALVHRYLISVSSSWTCLPGRLPRTSRRRSMMESRSTSFWSAIFGAKKSDRKVYSTSGQTVTCSALRKNAQGSKHYLKSVPCSAVKVSQVIARTAPIFSQNDTSTSFSSMLQTDRSSCAQTFIKQQRQACRPLLF